MEEKINILQMIENGTVSVEEGMRLLDALDKTAAEADIELGKAEEALEGDEDIDSDRTVHGKREQKEGFDEEVFHVSLMGKKEVVIDAFKASNVKIITEERDNIMVRHLDYSNNRDAFNVEVEDEKDYVKISEKFSASFESNKQRGRNGRSILDNIFEAADEVMNFGMDVLNGKRALFGNHELHIHMPSSYRGDLNVKGISGNLEANRLIAEGLRISMVSGDIRIGSLETKHSVIKVTSSDVDIDDFTGDLIISTVSGDIDLYTSELNGDVSVNMTSGDIALRLPATSAFGLTVATTSGDINCDFPVTVVGKMTKNRIRGKVVSEDHDITIKSISGDVDIVKHA